MARKRWIPPDERPRRSGPIQIPIWMVTVDGDVSCAKIQNEGKMIDAFNVFHSEEEARNFAAGAKGVVTTLCFETREALADTLDMSGKHLNVQWVAFPVTKKLMEIDKIIAVLRSPEKN
jgi:hypothetical protein